MDFETEDYVDAIEEGRIVKVPRNYAIKEGLLILRNVEKEGPDFLHRSQEKSSQSQIRTAKRPTYNLDLFRKSLKQNPSEISSTLIDNFHWNISSERRRRNLTRKQLSQSLNVPENDIKMIENGILPYEDYVLINKIQDYFKINLRKDGQNYSNTSILSESTENTTPTDNEEEKKDKQDKKSGSDTLTGSDIEIID